MDYYEILDEQTADVRPRDPTTDEAKAALMAFVDVHQTEVWYEWQLVVMFEQARRPRAWVNGDGFYHWIINRALGELVQETKSYIDAVQRRGGYTLVFEWQQYPFGSGALAEKVRTELSLPVDCRARIEDGTVQRFLKWHVKENGLAG